MRIKKITLLLVTAFLFIIILQGCDNTKNDNEKSPDSGKEALLKNNVQMYPDSILLVETLAQYYREAGNYGAAIETINKAIDRTPPNARLWDIKATLEFEDGDTTASINAFENAIDIYPDPAYIISLGTLYAQTKNATALVMADALLVADKARAEKEANFIKGLYYSYTGDKKKSIEYFDKCLQISYSFMDAYLEKSIALYDLGKYEDALAVLNKAITLQNSFDAGYYYKGKTLEKLNRKPEAADAYRMALLYDPQYAEAKDALAKLGYR